jgi:hypothetical protein
LFVQKHSLKSHINIVITTVIFYFMLYFWQNFVSATTTQKK